MYLNCPGGSTYSVLAIYDCMSWIKPKVGTGHVEDVRRQVNEAVQIFAISGMKIDKMYAAFTGQSLEKVQQYTERDRFLSVSEVMFCWLLPWSLVLLMGFWKQSTELQAMFESQLDRFRFYINCTIVKQIQVELCSIINISLIR
ncbi:hypothetical protein SASPL_128851 [Salvia splendens]|uniref:Uncharacterized protein n=1 Tax=Salvia splendens TaxID=180675 RepID=A0A8X8XD97_SALSN|nr:hypothetical protein SASPL_128851 [Salvia splendens]